MTLELEQRRFRVVQALWSEYDRAQRLHPAWPQGLVYGASIAMEESGEAVRAVNDHVMHGKGGLDEIRKEAIEAAVVWIRFLVESEEFWR